MGIEKIKELNEEERDLMNLKKEIEQWDKPWVVNYIGESKDKKFYIYKYKTITWETKEWIKNKFIKQSWAWIEWTKFIDEKWNEFKKDKFNSWETIYLKVPKKKNIKKWDQLNDPRNPLNPMNPIHPASPLNPTNPMHPASPLNPINR